MYGQECLIEKVEDVQFTDSYDRIELCSDEVPRTSLSHLTPLIAHEYHALYV